VRLIEIDDAGISPEIDQRAAMSFRKAGDKRQSAGSRIATHAGMLAPRAGRRLGIRGALDDAAAAMTTEGI
jgi:hypothetical protein